MGFMSRLIMLMLVIFSTSCVASSYSCNYLSVNGADDWYPYFARKHPGQHGIIGDIVVTAAKRAGIEVSMQPSIPWKRILFNLRYGSLDVIAGALKTEQREKQFNYSPEVHHADLKVFVRYDQQFNFTQLSDLEGLNGAKVRGMSLGQKADEYAFSHLVINDVPDPKSLLKMVATGRIDFGIFYASAGRKELKRNKLEEKIVLLDGSVSREGLFIAYSKSSKCQGEIEQLNQQIIKMKNDGSIRKIIAKYHANKMEVVEEKTNEN